MTTIVFPPMTDEEFLPLFAKWLKRSPKEFVPHNGFGRVATTRLPKSKFMRKVNAVNRGKRKEAAAAGMAPRREFT
jgi:hypothetical protein